jgi:hypothetical protein
LPQSFGYGHNFMDIVSTSRVELLILLYASECAYLLAQTVLSGVPDNFSEYDLLFTCQMRT